MIELIKEDYLRLYEAMTLIRTFEETAVALSESGELSGFVHPYSGEEAVAVGVCSELTDKDCIMSTHRGHGHIIAKGGDIKKMWAELYGKATGYSGGRSGSMHIADFSIGIIGANGIVGACLPIANGVAFALDYMEKDAVCICFFGDGASNHGTFHEALNLASVWDLPILFVNENNNLASTTYRRETMKIDRVSDRAAAYGMTGVTVDGNDVLAVKEATREAIQRLKSGGGQTLLECITWRHHQHFIGENSVYKDPAEQALWLSPEKDPIPRFEKRILSEAIAGADELAAIRKRAEEAVSEAVSFGRESPYPEPGSFLQHVYKE